MQVLICLRTMKIEDVNLKVLVIEAAGIKEPIIPRIIKKTPNRSRRRSMDLLVVTIGRFSFLFVTVIIQTKYLVYLKCFVSTQVLVVKVIIIT